MLYSYCIFVYCVHVSARVYLHASSQQPRAGKVSKQKCNQAST